MTTPTPKPRWYHLTPDRFFVSLLAVQVFLLLSDRFDWFAFNEKKGWTVLIAVGVGAAAVLVMLVWGIGCLLLRRRFQFGFRSLLVLLVAVSVPLGWFAWEMDKARRQREAVEEIVGAGGEVQYDYQFDKDEDFVGGEPTTPTWLLKLVGEDFLFDVVSATGAFSNDDMEHLKRLTSLRVLEIRNAVVTDTFLEELQGFSGLTGLGFVDAQVTDDALEHVSKLNRLQRLWIRESA